ncbi:DUF2624 domain-containing protein [Siminovitchia acidinfaciens]|uniref:DUF2624 domain-containing protein n=1 Tax=Siminovitchia acidinfaciens TaxID=2321395 RepID=A0A429XYL8_9BACI|nr:DUF2624 domain-containing protein [Siminovitchia acidinfaciens]RST73835.1 DUF2624 domain-containing protein [Siminovitchia acidinfaciens]
MKLIKNMVNYKLNMITADDLMKYASEFNIQLTASQAEKIAVYLRGKNFDLFDDNVRSKIIREIAKITGPKTAKEINQLFIQLTK